MDKAYIVVFVKELITSSKDEDIEVIKERIREFGEWLERTKISTPETKKLLKKIEASLPEIILIAGAKEDLTIEDLIAKEPKRVQPPEPKPKEKIIERHYHHYHETSSSGCGSSSRSYSGSGCGGDSSHSSSHC